MNNKQTVKDIVNASTTVATVDIPVSEAVNILTTTPARHIVLLDNQQHPLGWISQQHIIRLLAQTPPVVAPNLQQLVQSLPPTLAADSSIEAAYQTLQLQQSPSLILVDLAGKFAGLVTEEDFLRHLSQQPDRLAFMVHHDQLTQLPNRNLLELRLRQEVERAQRQQYQGCVFFIDLDRFKPVNEGLGHLVGDELLQAVAARLNARIRKGDVLARLGADEFMLLVFPLRDHQDAAIIARDLIQTLTTPFPLSSDNEVFISASVGISLFPQDGDHATELIKNADAAMSQAKNHGGNQFSYYSRELNSSARSRLALENELRRAIQHNELTLHYQPKVDLHTGQICGVEALARWQLADGRMIPPGEFIPIAEKSGLILELGTWLIDHACYQMRQWLDQNFIDLNIAINISARQFHSSNLDLLLKQALQKYHVAPQHLELELTESMLMQEPEKAVSTMQRLKEIGVSISLDDFGTGYSSLAYLTRFPIDTLKIDQSFVRNLITDPNAGEIAMAIISLAHRMKLRVVAEGVETEAHLAYLRNNHCDEMQGYYFSKPLPAPQLETLLLSRKSLPQREQQDHTIHKLLICSHNLDAALQLSKQLESVHYQISLSQDQNQTLEQLALNNIQLLIMLPPAGNDLCCDLLNTIRDSYPHTVRLLLVAPGSDFNALQNLVDQNIVHKLISRDLDEKLLRQHVQQALLLQTHKTESH